jgi:hypothetical protein
MRGFSTAMADGKLTIGQATYRASMYGNNAIQVFSAMELRAIGDSVLSYARRSLTSGFDHCEQCKLYVTYPAWVPVEDVTPIAVNCDCRGNCKCRIEYSSNPPAKLIFRTS